MNKRWQVIVELTFDPFPTEPPHKALDRVKLSLDALLERSPTTGCPISHYHILQQPKIVAEFD